MTEAQNGAIIINPSLPFDWLHRTIAAWSTLQMQTGHILT